MVRVIFFFFHVVCLSVENEKSNKKSSSRFFSFVVLGLGFEKKQKRSAFPPSLCFVPKKTPLSLSLLLLLLFLEGDAKKLITFFCRAMSFSRFYYARVGCVVFALMR